MATTAGSWSGCATPSADDRAGEWDDGTSAEGAWLELSVEADSEAVEAVAEILARVSSGGTSVEPAFSLVDEGLGAEIDPTRPAIVRGYLPARDTSAARAAVSTVRTALGHLRAFDLRPIGELTVRLVHEADWAEAWKEHFPVLRVGRRIVIRPTWRHHRRRPDDVVIALDPGMAFGTGLHPTTRLCLAGLERWADEGFIGDRGGGQRGDGQPGGARPRGARPRGARVLDVGCGSGILTIAAALLGAGTLLGVDTDPIAIEATLANAGRNRLDGRLVARVGSVPTGEPPFDLVVANLIASVLVVLARALAQELTPGGRLLASGIFVDREGEVRTAFEAAGLDVERRDVDGDWIALDAVLRGS